MFRRVVSYAAQGFVLLLAALAFALPANAHPVPFSYIDIQLQPDAVDLSLVAHIFDLGHDLGIAPIERLLDPAVLAGQTTAIRALLQERVQLSVDGHLLKGDWLSPEILAER